MQSSFPSTGPRVFKRLTVDANFNAIVGNRVLIEWALFREFVEPGPYTFTLYRGYAANTNDWEALATTVDQPWLYDNRPVWPQKGLNVFYRVGLTDGNDKVWYSQPVAAGTFWGRYDWTLAREIIRKEHLMYRKRAGTPGWLLKRRVWGDPCPSCVDPDTGMVTDPLCETCFGTGIAGGYYDPFEYWVVMNPTQRLGKLDPQQGLITKTLETVRALAYPRPDLNDVWVNHYTNQRYIVQGDVAAIARHRGVDLVLNVRLQERPRSDPIYGIETPCEMPGPNAPLSPAGYTEPR